MITTFCKNFFISNHLLKEWQRKITDFGYGGKAKTVYFHYTHTLRHEHTHTHMSNTPKSLMSIFHAEMSFIQNQKEQSLLIYHERKYFARAIFNYILHNKNISWSPFYWKSQSHYLKWWAFKTKYHLLDRFAKDGFNIEHIDEVTFHIVFIHPGHKPREIYKYKNVYF